MIAFSTMLGCATCFGNPDSTMTHGMNLAIFTLLGVTGLVLGGLGALMIYFVRRARRYQIADEILSELPKTLPKIG